MFYLLLRRSFRRVRELVPTASYITKRSINPSTGASRSRVESAKRDRIRLEFFSEILLRKLFSNFSNSGGSPSFLRRGFPKGGSTPTFSVVGPSWGKTWTSFPVERAFGC